MPTKLTVTVAADQFEELCRPSQPLAAVAELIWNGLDAEAPTVEVVIERTELDAVKSVTVTDDGHGMTNADAIRDFGNLGGSWKRGKKLSRNGVRSLHGAKGQGRFRAFALGTDAEWSSVSTVMEGLERTTITASTSSSEFVVSDPEQLGSGSAGTTVKLTGARITTGALLGDNATTWLISRFAPYLARYTDVVVMYDGTQLDPSEILERSGEITLDASIGGEFGAPVLRVMEWKSGIVALKSSILLCDADGVALYEIKDEIPEGRKFTAYLEWPGFAAHEKDLALGEMGHAVLGPVIEAGRETLSTYFEDRTREERTGIIEEWKKREVYPFKGDPTTGTERRERQVFDVIATTAASAVPSEKRAAKLSLGLMRSALEQSPGALHRVLQEVLDLTPEQVEEFDNLLRTASLPSVIAATAKVVERLTFLDDLQRLLFSPDGKKLVRERDQLHEILAARTWIFGEEYALVVSDKTLTTVLKEHLKLFGDDRPVIGPVTDAGGNKSRRVDLMLSRSAEGTDGRRHLVVELKRPAVKLGNKEFAQILKYAGAVVKDPAFKAPDVTWDFWLLGDDYDDVIDTMAHQDNLPVGVVMQTHPYTVRVRRWAEIIEENRKRLHFYKQHLDYQAEADDSLDATLNRYLTATEVLDATDEAAAS